jgi:cytochrome c peroxidase
VREFKQVFGKDRIDIDQVTLAITEFDDAVLEQAGLS